MLNLFQKIRRTTLRTCRIPDGWRIYAVGDIHGRADLLKRLHDHIARDAADAADARENMVVYLGDYLDRGPYVKETIDELISGVPDGFHAKYLQGNHEQMFLDFIGDSSSLGMWLELGGQSTLMNYRVKSPFAGASPAQAEAVRQEIVKAMPDAHLEFLRSLEPFFKMGDYLFVHAGVRPGVPLHKQSSIDLFWARSNFSGFRAACDMKIVHGHTIFEQVQQDVDSIGIDTGAYATGVLTSAVLEEDRIRFLSTAPTALQG